MSYFSSAYPNPNPHEINEYILTNQVYSFVGYPSGGQSDESTSNKLLKPELLINFLDKDLHTVGKKNTIKAYKNRHGNKAKCYQDMCAHIGVSELVTQTKLISFLMYCATRNKCKTGENIQFDLIQYDELEARHKLSTFNDEEATEGVLCNVADPLGYEAMKQHKLAVKGLHQYQLDSRKKRNSWEDCFGTIPQQIMNICRRRIKIIKRKRKIYEEDDVFIAYNCADEIGNIFNYMNLDIKSLNTPLQKYNMNLRILAIMSTTLFGAIRGETILSAELRDLNFLRVKSKDPSTIDLLIIKMFEGE